jgi:hypothetical protein
MNSSRNRQFLTVGGQRQWLHLFALAIAGLASLLSVELLAAEKAKPDFSGVYLFYGGRMAGFSGGGQGLPLNTEAQAKVAEVQQVLDGTGETAGGWCLGGGMPDSMMGSGAYPMEIIQRPEQITVIYEAHGEIRRIYIGDENQMAEEDKFPDRNGYSKGWWEGDELVVETTHLKEQLDGRYPHSEEATVLERYHWAYDDGKKILVADMVLTDPKFLKEPFKATKRWQPNPEGFMLPYECAEPNWLERIEEIRRLKKEGKPVGVM